MQYRGQESTFYAAVVDVEPGDHAEVEWVRAVGPCGGEVRFEAFAGEDVVGAVGEVTIRAT